MLKLKLKVKGWLVVIPALALGTGLLFSCGQNNGVPPVDPNAGLVNNTVVGPTTGIPTPLGPTAGPYGYGPYQPLGGGTLFWWPGSFTSNYMIQQCTTGGLCTNVIMLNCLGQSACVPYQYGLSTPILNNYNFWNTNGTFYFYYGSYGANIQFQIVPIMSYVGGTYTFGTPWFLYYYTAVVF